MGRLIKLDSEVWGILAEVPVDDSMKKVLGDIGIAFPKQIKRIAFLTTRPGETIDLEFQTGSMATAIDRLMSVTDRDWDIMPEGLQPAVVVEESLIKVFQANKKVKGLFNNILRDSKNKTDTVLIIEGHGGGVPLKIGEKGGSANFAPAQRWIDKFDVKDNPYAAIIIQACNPNEDNLMSNYTPLFYVHGLATPNIKVGEVQYYIPTKK